VALTFFHLLSSSRNAVTTACPLSSIPNFSIFVQWSGTHIGLIHPVIAAKTRAESSVSTDYRIEGWLCLVRIDDVHHTRPYIPGRDVVQRALDLEQTKRDMALLVIWCMLGLGYHILK